MGHKLLALFTSRWTEAFVLLLWIIALRTHQRWLVVVALVLAAAVVAALIGVFIAGQRRRRYTQTQSSDTPEREQLARRGETESKKIDKNKIETTQ